MDKFIFMVIGAIFLIAFLACIAMIIRVAGILLFIVLAAMMYWLFKGEDNNED